MVKSKLPALSGSRLEAVEPRQQKGAIKFFLLVEDVTSSHGFRHENYKFKKGATLFNRST